MDALASEARALDPVRYAAALYAPEARRPQLFALAMFSGELARLPQKVTKPELGEIRLQWWRDALTGGDNAQGHPAAAVIRSAIDGKIWPLAAFLNMIDARAFALYDDRMPSAHDLEGWLGETHGALFQLAALALDAQAAAGALSGHAGCAEGAAALLYASSPRLQAAAVPADMDGADGLRAFGIRHAAECAPLLAGLPASLRPAFLPLAVAETSLRRNAPLSPLAFHWVMLKTAIGGWRSR